MARRSQRRKSGSRSAASAAKPARVATNASATAPTPSRAAPLPEAAPSTASGTVGLDGWLALLLAVTTVALYWPVHAYDFVNLDDIDYVRRNPPVLAGLTPASIKWALTSMFAGFWMPLTWLSLMLDSQLYGTGPGGYHVTNVLLHTASSVLVFALLAAATGRRWPALFAAGLFALHPLHVESVAWITERKDTLSTLFLFLTLWSYGRYARQPGRGRYVATLVLFVLGLVAKPMLITLPVLFLLLDYWPLRRFSEWPSLRLLYEKVPFLALGVAASLLTLFAGQHFDPDARFEGTSIGAALSNPFHSPLKYLLKTIYPVGLCVYYPAHGVPPPWQTALAALVLAGATAVAFALRSRHPYVLVGWLWFLVALLPVSGIVKIGHFTIADRFTYVPLLGIFVAVAWAADGVAHSPMRRAIAATLGVAALAASIVIARVQLGYWRDGVTLFERTIAVTDANPIAQYLLGLALADRGRSDEAMEHYEEALRLRPGYVHAHGSLGLLLFERGKVDEGIAHYTAALEQNPDDAEVHTNLGNALLHQGRIEEAIGHYQEAIRIDPDAAEARNGYGNALAAAGRLAESAEQYAQALGADANNPEAHNNLANALADRGAIEDALAHYAAAIRLRPTYVTAHSNMAILLAQHGRLAEAVEHFHDALRINPDDARIHADLGNALAAQGKLDEAAAEFTEALRLDPNQSGAYNNLANVLAMAGRTDEAITKYNEAIRLDASNADAHANLGIVLAERGRANEAIGHYREALRINPRHVAAHTRLGILLKEQGQRDEARSHLAEAVRLDPSNELARHELDAM